MTYHPTVFDWRGNTYTVGSTILYPRASGRSLEMQEGTVLKITETETPEHYYNRDTKTHGARFVTKRTVRVRPTKSSRFTWGQATHDTTLQITENITAVVG